MKKLKMEYEYLKEALISVSLIARDVVDISEEYLYNTKKEHYCLAEQNLFYFDSIKFSLNNLIEMSENIELNFEELSKHEKFYSSYNENFKVLNIVETFDNSDENIVLFRFREEKEVERWVEDGETIADIFKRDNKIE